MVKFSLKAVRNWSGVFEDVLNVHCYCNLQYIFVLLYKQTITANKQINFQIEFDVGR